ncbi:HAMP domain-containing sensor histidine kinase [Sciscionella marina]|uniref:HAMP domain-containing sensor histidine kinase n=1 Tax=Sciscionella marina TaxID=508770 RepID=UPI0003628A6D|nr:HAMP domain-containing sensor histidine kinase [Sciscionella marina]
MTGLVTTSLRRRVLVAVLAVFLAVLAATVLAVGLLFSAESAKAVNTVLADRMRLARQLDARGVPPEQLIRRLDRRAVRAELDLPDGRVYGRVPGEDRADSRTVRLRDGSRLILAPETRLLSGAQGTLIRVLIITGIVALAATTVLIILVVRMALAPLDTMAGMARRIAAGERGNRLAPRRTDTEIGRTAQAIDEMLNALEGAEHQARESELSTRRFVADAAHELRTPIAGMSSVAEVLLGGGELEQQQRERLRTLLRGQSRLAAKLVEDLLDLAKLDIGISLDREPLELHGLAEAECQRIRLAHNGMHATVRGTATVCADPARVTQILVILLDNAAQATPEDGRITVDIRAANGFALLRVIDSGRGVPARERERIFDRLVRLDPARAQRPEGSGLGLAIARGYARAHGGELRCVTPESGSGAAFELTLPLSG